MLTRDTGGEESGATKGDAPFSATGAATVTCAAAGARASAVPRVPCGRERVRCVMVVVGWRLMRTAAELLSYD